MVRITARNVRIQQVTFNAIGTLIVRRFDVSVGESEGIRCLASRLRLLTLDVWWTAYRWHCTRSLTTMRSAISVDRCHPSSVCSLASNRNRSTNMRMARFELPTRDGGSASLMFAVCRRTSTHCCTREVRTILSIDAERRHSLQASAVHQQAVKNALGHSPIRRLKSSSIRLTDVSFLETTR